MHWLADLKKAYKDIGPSVDKWQNTIEIWNVEVLLFNIVTFSLPVELKLTLKGTPLNTLESLFGLQHFKNKTNNGSLSKVMNLG